MSAKTSILLFTTLLYAATIALGIAAAGRLAVSPEAPELLQLELTLADAAIFLAVFVLFTFVILRFARIARPSLNIFLTLVMLIGARYVFAAWLPAPWDWAAALGVALLGRLWPRVLAHDLAIGLGIAGISGLLGLSLTPPAAVVLLAVLSMYDIYSVYRSRQMVALAGRMLESGAVFGFLVPAKPHIFFRKVSEALDARSVMMLGSGDIGLPLVLAASAVTQSYGAAAAIGIGALLGMLLMQWLWMRQAKPLPMAALPPIAAFSILGYLVAVLLGL